MHKKMCLGCLTRIVCPIMQLHSLVLLSQALLWCIFFSCGWSRLFSSCLIIICYAYITLEHASVHVGVVVVNEACFLYYRQYSVIHLVWKLYFSCSHFRLHFMCPTTPTALFTHFMVTFCLSPFMEAGESADTPCQSEVKPLTNPEHPLPLK